jgi:hypothetical protein
MLKTVDSKKNRRAGLTIEALENRDLMTTLPVHGVDPSATRDVAKPANDMAARVDHTSAAGVVARDDHAGNARHGVRSPAGEECLPRTVRHDGAGNTAASKGGGLGRGPGSSHAAKGSNRIAAPVSRPGLRRPSYDVAIDFSYVGSPGNESVAINGFVPPSRATVPARIPSTDPGVYQDIGGVPYNYAIGQTEVTAGQYVTFLNKVDPNGDNPVQPVTGVRLWVNAFSPVLNPFSGEINLVQNARPGTHYQLAASYWRDKPLVNGNLFHFAYFANSLYNGTTVAIDDGRGRSPLGYPVRLQTRYVNLSTTISTGMYDLQDSSYAFFHRLNTSGYVIPSENEWVKAAYYSPSPTGNGTHYYYYPTVSNSPPTPLQTADPRPTVDGLGNVIQSNLTPRVAYSNTEKDVAWQPPYDTQPSRNGANVVNVGEDRTPSPWLTYDQGGNVVEYTDTVAVPPAGFPNPRDLPVFVKVHGGIANAANYQLWLTSTGTSDPYGQAAGQTDTQGGARFGYVPDAKADRFIRGSRGVSSSAVATPLVSNGLVYRLDNLNTLNTFYTADLSQAVTLANDPSTYVFLGASFGQPTSAASTPVYGFLDNTTRTQFYTIDPKEAAAVSANPQFSREGIVFTALPPDVGTTNFRRFFNSATGAYAYSAADADVQFFTSRGYTFDGYAWSVS